MPRSSARPCAAPGCAALTRARFCDRHAGRDHAQDLARRGSERDRGYDSAWRKLSLRYRRANPLCVRCQGTGKLTPVDLVDHIVPVDVDPSLRMVEDNLQSLCRSCHATKTSEDERRYGSPAARASRRAHGRSEGEGR